MRCERGVATVECTALVLVVALACGALLTVGPSVDGRLFGALIAHRITCAVKGGCDDGDDELAAAYGEDAALVRRYAPSLVYEPGVFTLPVDPRECRDHRCSDAPDDPDLDVHRSARGGVAATAFTHLVRDGGETFIQYWLYYPDSTSTALNLAGGWRAAAAGYAALDGGHHEYPGYHRDDWESYQVRLDAHGRAWARASSHHGYQSCKQRRCKNRWTPSTGWTRVSWGSHAGHIPLRSRIAGVEPTGRRLPPVRLRRREQPLYPGAGLRERSSTAPGLRLVPLERYDRRSYRRLDPDISPPWEKEVYRDPRSNSTG